MVIDTDLATVTAAADRIIRVLDSEPWLLHVELQSSPKSGLTGHLHWYNTLVGQKHGQLVRSVLVLLRPSADSPSYTGIHECGFAGEPPYIHFRHQVIRLWQIPAGQFLAGGLGTMPLAPIAQVAEAELPAVVQQMDERLAREADPEQAKILIATAAILTSLRLPPEAVAELYQGVRFMSVLEDSSIGQMLEHRSRVREMHDLLLRLGLK